MRRVNRPARLMPGRHYDIAVLEPPGGNRAGQ
jgi:hypothetical protein